MSTLNVGDRLIYEGIPLTVREVRDTCDDGPGCPLGGGPLFRYDDGEDEDWLHASRARRIGG